MGLKKRRTQWITLLAVSGALLGGLGQANAGRLSMAYYGNVGTAGSAISGELISDLTEAPAYPDNPAVVSGGEIAAFGQFPYLDEGLQWPPEFQEGDSFGNEYGTETEGYIEVPASGEWKFFIRSDDGSRLDLNPDGHEESGANPIAEVPGEECCDAFVDDGVRSSDPIELQKGTQYYIRVLHKEGEGGDWWQVGWQGPNMSEPQVIDARFVQEFVSESGVLEIVTPPENVTVQETDPMAHFDLTVRATPEVEYQWFINGDPIEGATSPFLDYQTSLGDDGAEITVEVSNASGTVDTTDSPAILTVEPDTTAPVVQAVTPRGDPNGVSIFFSEPVSESTALNADNYSIDDGAIEIESVEFFAGNTRRVRLNTTGSGFEVGSTHSVEISDVEDRAEQPNVLDPNPTTTEFVFGRKAPDYAWLFNQSSGDTAQPFSGGRTGSLDNGAAFASDSPFSGKSGSVQFDGEDDVIDFGDLTFNGAEKFSMSMWIKAANTSMDRGFFEFVDSGGADAWGIGYDSEGATGGGVEGLKVGITTSESPTTNETADQQESMENIQTTDWQHIAWTWEDGEGFNLYIDGQLDEPVSPMERTEGALDQMEFFRLGDGRKDYWQGLIGETAIWEGSVLTEEQVQLLANQSVADNGEAWPLQEVGPVEITTQPQPQTVTEPNPATFSVEVGGAPPHFFQWRADGEPIEGASSQSFTTAETLPSESGTQYSVVVSNEFSQVTSDAVTLTVEEDTTAPSLTGAGGAFGASSAEIFSKVRLTFDEELAQESAENPDNYSLDPALDVTGATLLEDGTTVELETAEQEQSTRYTVTVDGVTDQAETPNATSGATAEFVSWTTGVGGLQRYFYPDVSGASLDTDFYTGPGERDNPDQVPAGFAPLGDDPGSDSTIIDIFESGRDVADGYHAIMRGWLVPPEDGDYTFYLSADDQAQLWLSTDADPGNATMIAEEPEWNSERDWTGTERRTPSDPENISRAYTLSAGEPAYVEAVFAEGGGGDGMEVTWQAPGQEPPTDGTPSRITAEHLRATLPTAQTIPPWNTSITTAANLPAETTDLAVEFSGLNGAEIQSVEYFVDDESIGVVESSPFSLIWDPSGGLHTVRAEATDNLGRVGADELQVAVDEAGSPSITDIRGSASLENVTLTFSEPVTVDSAQETANYSITDDAGSELAVNNAALSSDRQTVTLTTGTQTAGTKYTVSVSEVVDAIGNPVNEDALFFGVGGLVQADDGTVSIEAESFSNKEAPAAHEWVFADEESGFSGTGYMEALPNDGDNFSDPGEFTASSPRLDFEVDFDQAGTYYLWVRGFGASGSDDSVHVGFNEEPLESSIRIAGFDAGFGWSNGRQSPSEGTPLIEVGSPGTHTVNVWMREDGFLVDKILLVPDEGFEPSGLGPDETREGQAPALPTGEIVSPANLSSHSPGNVEIEVSASSEEVGIFKVNFLVDGQKVGEATSSPYTTMWDASTGIHSITAEIVDLARQSATAGPVEVGVGDVTPQVVSAGAFPGESKAGVLFDNAVVEPGATDPSNYQISDHTVTGASIDESGTAVTLTTEQAIESEFTVTVSGAEGRFGNVVDSEASGTLSTLSHEAVGFDIGMEDGDPLVPGTATFFGDGHYDIEGGGSDIWNTDDAMHFVYEEVTGDFDKRVRAQELTMAGSTWAKAGLMARVDTSPGSRHVMNIITPPEGENAYVGQERLETDGESQRWNADGGNASPGVPLPNAWIRLQREGSTFLAYRSEDGENWTQTDEVEREDLPETLLVGMPVTSHDNSEGGTVLAQFRSYGDVAVTEVPELSIALEDGTVTVTWDGPGTLETASAIGGPWEEASSENQDGEATFSVAEHDELYIRLVE